MASLGRYVAACWDKLTHPQLRAWPAIKLFLSSGFVKSTSFWVIAVPFAARLTRFLPEVMPLTISGEEYRISLTLPFSWKCLFFGSCSFLAARILYLLFCPRLCKHHVSYESFRSGGYGVDHLRDYALDEGEESVHISPTLDFFQGRDTYEHESEIKNVFWKLVAALEMQHPFVRNLTFGLILCGTGLITWVALENIVFVASLALRGEV